MAKRGNKAGTVRRGSLVWHIAKLEPGQYLLVDTQEYHYRGTGGAMSNLEVAIRRGRARGALPLDRAYVVRTCLGILVDLSEKPFRFLRVTCESITADYQTEDLTP